MTTYEMRYLDKDGALDTCQPSLEDVIEYLTGAVPSFLHNGQVIRLTIDAAFGTIEIIPQGGLSLLVE